MQQMVAAFQVQQAVRDALFLTEGISGLHPKRSKRAHTWWLIAAAMQPSMGVAYLGKTTDLLLIVQERRDFLHKALSDISSVRLPNPDGAFYMMPDVSAFIGPHVQASGFGAVPDVDALCRCIFKTRWS